MSGRAWLDWELTVLREYYADLTAEEIAAALKRGKASIYGMAKKLGLVKSEDFSVRQGRIHSQHPAAVAQRLKPGSVPPNKGLRRPGYAPGRMAETQFKKGSMSGAAQHNYVPIGTLKVAMGVLLKKVTDDPSMYPARRWVPVHRSVWIAAHGPVPKGHIVIFRPGLKTLIEAEITLDRLELVSHAENMRRNTYHNRYPEEVRQLIRTRGALTKTINTRRKRLEEQDSGCPEHSDRSDGGDQGR